MKTVWTPEQRAAALVIYREFGPAEAGRRTGVPKQTIASWARRTGVHTDAPSRTREAVEMAALSREQRVAALAEKALTEAEIELTRLRAPLTLHKLSASGREVSIDLAEPEASDRKAIAQTFATLFGQSQLAAGHATSRTEVVGEERVQRVADEIRRRFRVVDPEEAA